MQELESITVVRGRRKADEVPKGRLEVSNSFKMEKIVSLMMSRTADALNGALRSLNYIYSTM